MIATKRDLAEFKAFCANASDSEESYLESVYQEEIATLKADIEAMSAPQYV